MIEYFNKMSTSIITTQLPESHWGEQFRCPILGVSSTNPRQPTCRRSPQFLNLRSVSRSNVENNLECQLRVPIRASMETSNTTESQSTEIIDNAAYDSSGGDATNPVPNNLDEGRRASLPRDPSLYRRLHIYLDLTTSASLLLYRLPGYTCRSKLRRIQRLHEQWKDEFLSW